ncbi:hypothetical protein CTZ27_20610 [Streptomyces griseocarneus]|nr:hypothetical protein CTZ27_20610 [Streptomyces griseocarneus]
MSCADHQGSWGSIATWCKSSHSQSSGGCVEIADQFNDAIPVRDPKILSRAAPGRPS